MVVWELTRTSGNPYREVMLDDVHIRPIQVTDAGEVFTLQRAAFVEEAHLYETLDTPALTQTFQELKAELASNGGYVALLGSRMVGSVTARMVGDQRPHRQVMESPLTFSARGTSSDS